MMHWLWNYRKWKNRKVQSEQIKEQLYNPENDDIMIVDIPKEKRKNENNDEQDDGQNDKSDGISNV